VQIRANPLNGAAVQLREPRILTVAARVTVQFRVAARVTVQIRFPRARQRPALESATLNDAIVQLQECDFRFCNMYFFYHSIFYLPRMKHTYLRRFPREHYQGFAWVHWTMGIEGRRQGWLDAVFHVLWRELLIHCAHRYHLAFPVYCLMPDHVHLLTIGMHDSSDQLTAIAFLRRHSAVALRNRGYTWQRQAFDHVMQNEERRAQAFQAVSDYVLRNPVRAGLVLTRDHWPYAGSMMAGYPDLNPQENDFWDYWWRAHASECARLAGPQSENKPPLNGAAVQLREHASSV
jgi:REP element-mobilizing transposase RayT